MHYFQLLGDVLYAGRQPNHRITRLVVALANAHKAHAGHTDGSSCHCRKDFNHRGSGLLLYLSDLGRDQASCRGLALTAFQNPASSAWASPAGAAVVRCRFYCGRPLSGGDDANSAQLTKQVF
jgi:hypothetical protein